MRRRGPRRGPPRLVWVLGVTLGPPPTSAFLAAHGFGALAPVLQQTGAQHLHRHDRDRSTRWCWRARAALAGVRVARHVPGLRALARAGPSRAAQRASCCSPCSWSRWPRSWRRSAACRASTARTPRPRLLVCISSPVAGQPLHSLDRYTLTIFPLWMAAAAWIARAPARRARRARASAALLAFFAFQFAHLGVHRMSGRSSTAPRSSPARAGRARRWPAATIAIGARAGLGLRAVHPRRPRRRGAPPRVPRRRRLLPDGRTAVPGLGRATRTTA